MLSTKCEGLKYPTHFLKSRGSVIRNNFLEYRTKQATLIARRNNFYALIATNKAKHNVTRHAKRDELGVISEIHFFRFLNREFYDESRNINMLVGS